MRKGRFFFLSVFTLSYSTALMIALLLPGSSYPTHAIFSVDKIWHMLCYAILFLGLYSTFNEIHDYSNTSIIWAGFLALSHASISEYFQQFSPGRASDISDWLADVLGVALALLLINVIRRFRERVINN
jgi:VanZ family protein